MKISSVLRHPGSSGSLKGTLVILVARLENDIDLVIGQRCSTRR